MDVRPMTPSDVPAAAVVSIAALGLGSDLGDDEFRALHEDRVGHMQQTDPDGAWVADEDGEVVGLALAIVRDRSWLEGLWGLSLLAVRPDRQAQGIGRDLLDASLRTAREAGAALILSSTDPRAMRRYARAGFALHPCVGAAGIPSVVRDEPGAEEVSPAEAAGIARLAGRAVRGAAYDARDLQMLVDGGSSLLAIPGRGFAAHRDGSPKLLAATDEDAAAALLRACFAAAPRGGTVQVDLIHAGNDWAVRTCLDAGLALSPDGPLFTRGTLGPLRPWIPSGALV